MIQKIRQRTKVTSCLMRLLVGIPVAAVVAVARVIVRDMGRSFRLPPT